MLKSFVYLNLCIHIIVILRMRCVKDGIANSVKTEYSAAGRVLLFELTHFASGTCPIIKRNRCCSVGCSAFLFFFLQSYFFSKMLLLYSPRMIFIFRLIFKLHDKKRLACSGSNLCVILLYCLHKFTHSTCIRI